MAITPSNQTLAVGALQEFLSSIQYAVWSLSLDLAAGTNFALASNGALVTVTSNYNSDPAHNPTVMLNGTHYPTSATNYWLSGDDPNTTPQEIVVTFSSAKTINRVNFFTVGGNLYSTTEPLLTDTFNAYGITDFTLDYWSGTRWLNLKIVRDNNKIWTQMNFAEITTTKIRIRIFGSLTSAALATEVEALYMPVIGTFSAGTSAYKKKLTATNVGTSTLTATRDLWFGENAPDSGCTIDGNDAFTYDGVGGVKYYYGYNGIRLTATGDYIEFVAPDTSTADNRLGIADTVTNYGIVTIGYYGSVFNINNASGSNNSASLITPGCVIRLTRRSDNGVDVAIDGKFKFSTGSIGANSWMVQGYFNGAATLSKFTWGGSGITGAPPSESTTVTTYQPLAADFALSSSPYNYGSAITATDATIGGGGARTRTWKVDGVAISPADPLNVIFSGLSLGLHTISLTVSDSSPGSPNTKTATIYVGQITPGNASIPIGGSQEFTLTIANAIAAVSGAGGTLGTGSTAYKKLFTATAAGSATLTATGSNWGNVNGTSVNANDNVVISNGASFLVGSARLLNTGDKVGFTLPTGFSNATLQFFLQTSEANQNTTTTYFSIYSQSYFVGGTQYSQLLNDGDVITYELTSATTAVIKRNGTILGTLTHSVSGGFLPFVYTSGLSNGTVIPHLVYSLVGRSATPSESTTFTVYTPPSISTSSPLPSVVIGNNFAQQLAAAGGSGAGTWAIVSNDAIQPIALSSSGLATRAATALGTINFTVRFTDSNPAYGSVDKAFQLAITLPPPAPPIITSKTPLPYGQIGHSYSYQLKKLGGAGTGTWMMIAGNLPDGALSSSGLITLPSVGASNYSFSVRYTDDAGFDQEGLTIPVSVYAAITFIYKRPLQIDYIQKQRYFEPLEGGDEVIEDAPMKREFTLNVLFTNRAEGDYLRQFLSDHRNRQTFLWVNPDRNNEVLTVKMVSKFSEQQLYADGYFQIVIREV